MKRFCTLCLIAVVWIILVSASNGLAQDLELPERTTPRPQTTNGVPHVQIGITANPELSDALLLRVEKFPGVTLGATRVSLPGAIGFQLDRGVELARPDAIVGGREFAHLHPDGSLHASLDPQLAKQAIVAGWAVEHPWARRRRGWEGFVMIYTPSNQSEMEVVYRLVRASFNFVTGGSFRD